MEVSEKITPQSVNEINNQSEIDGESLVSDPGIDLNPTVPFDESDIKRLSKEIEHQHIFPLTSTLTQVYQHDIEQKIYPLIQSSIKAHENQLELICHRGYEPLFNSLNQVTRTTDKVHSLANTSKAINKELRKLVIDQQESTRSLNVISKQRKNLNDTVDSLSQMMPVLTEFSRIIDYKNSKKQYFALKTILKVEQKIKDLPVNLQSINFIDNMKEKLPEFKNDLKISCKEEISDWLELVHKETMKVRSFDDVKSGVFTDFGDESFVPLYRAKNVYQTLNGLSEFSGDFKTKRNEQRKLIITLPNESQEISDNNDNDQNLVNISEMEAYLARITAFFTIERTISQTVPEFCDGKTLEAHYRETVNFGLLMMLKQAMMDIDDISMFELLYALINKFLQIENDYLPEECINGIKEIKENIHAKCFDEIIQNVKLMMIDVLMKDSYAPVRNGDKNIENGHAIIQHMENSVSEHDISVISEISAKSDETITNEIPEIPEISTNSEEFKRFLRILREAKRNFPQDKIKIPSRSSIGFSEMVPRICFKLVEFLELIKNQPSQPLPCDFEYFTHASVIAFKKCLENALQHNKFEERANQIRPMKQLYVNMSYMSYYAPIVLKQEFFNRHFGFDVDGRYHDQLPVKAWKDSVAKLGLDAGLKIDNWFSVKFDELFEMEPSDRNIRQFVDVNMHEIEMHCDDICKEQRYIAL